MRRAAPLELRRAGKRLHGVIVQEGSPGRDRAELFAPESVTWPQSGIGIKTGHREARAEATAVPSRLPDGRIVVSAYATDAIRDAYASGRRELSVEFRAIRERRTGGGIRVIESAFVADVAMVHVGEYGDVARAEVRRLAPGSWARTRIPVGGQALYCSCSAAKTGSRTASYVRFARGAFEGIESADVAAVTGGLSQTVASTATGSLRLSTDKAGRLVVTLNPLDTRHGRDLLDLIRSGVPVYARPVWDPEASDWELDGEVAEVKRAVFGLVLVKPVKDPEGLEPLAMGREGRGLSVGRRALLAGLA